MTNIQAVIFDLFGTLISLAHETKPYLRLFKDIGLQTPEEFRVARGIAISEDFDDLAGLVKRIDPDVQIDLASYEREVEKERASATLFPAAIDEKLKDAKSGSYSLSQEAAEEASLIKKIGSSLLHNAYKASKSSGMYRSS